MKRDEIKNTVTPRVCYMGNVQTLDTFAGLMAAERYIMKNNISVSTSFGNKSYEKPTGKILDCGYVYLMDDTDIDAYEGAIEMLNNRENIYAFTNNPLSLENLYLSMYAKTLYKVSMGLKLRDYEVDFLFEKNDFAREGKLKRGGWIFNYKPFLKKFWVKDECGSIREYFSFNQKFLKKFLKRYDESIVQIIEVK